MRELFQTILLRVTVAGIASAVALRVVGGGALREIVKLAAGLLMLLALLQPLAGLRLSVSSLLPGGLDATEVEEIEQQNAQTAMTTIAASIAHALEDSAAAAGFDCRVQVEMGIDADGILQVSHVAVYYDSADAKRLDELKTIITDGCGVGADRQEWILE